MVYAQSALAITVRTTNDDAALHAFTGDYPHGLCCGWRAVKDGATTLDGVEDCRAVLKFFQDNAEQLNLDTERMVIVAGSAGGHLSLVTALAEGRDGGALPKLNACVAF